MESPARLSAIKGSKIAIIGASLTGLSLALSLLQASLYGADDITIYDFRQRDSPDAASQSGVVLTPNGLSVLDALGVLSRFRDRCWLSEYRTYKNDRDETVRKVLIADVERYGYKNHRVWRRLLLEALLAAVEERGVRISWGEKFETVLNEDQTGVVFRVNGREVHADVLIGADGIHSYVRKYLDFGAGPEYTGVMGVIGHIPRGEVQWPYAEYEKACTIQGKPGALVMMPEDREGSVIMVAMQVRMEAKTREQWDKLARDKDWLRGFFRQVYDDWGATPKKIIDALDHHADTLYVWPFMRMARLNRWFSATGRVIILGDAAHALPPSSGQGINQTLEDVYTLSKLLKAGRESVQALAFWQQMRQERIDSVFDWATNATNVQRMPQAERDRLVKEGKAKDANATEGFDDVTWLYVHKIDENVDAWLKKTA